MSVAETMAKFASLPEILTAAQTLQKHGLLKDETAEDVVKRYVQANPDINQMMQRMEDL